MLKTKPQTEQLAVNLYRTTNYDQFKTLIGNRELYGPHIKRLVHSISKQDLLEHNPILVNEAMEVIDGQHRLAAARELGVPLYYTTVSGTSIETAQELNIANRGWNTADFLESYVKRGFPDYITLKEFVIRYETPIIFSASLLSYNQERGAVLPGEIGTVFRSGQFKITDEAYAIEFMTKFNDLEPNAWRHELLLHSLGRLFSQIDANILLSKLSETGIRIHRGITAKDYLRQFEDVYNFRSKTPLRLY
jgi:hypothetical protein